MSGLAQLSSFEQTLSRAAASPEPPHAAPSRAAEQAVLAMAGLELTADACRDDCSSQGVQLESDTAAAVQSTPDEIMSDAKQEAQTWAETLGRHNLLAVTKQAATS